MQDVQDSDSPAFIITTPEDGASVARLLLAHGAGAPMTSPFMETMAALLAEVGVETWRFEFAYMAARRTQGKRRPPPRAELLRGEYVSITQAAAGRIAGNGGPRLPLLIGGKSMGGRVATMVLAELSAAGTVAGAVALGYPFHPPGRPEKPRTEHLEALSAPLLIVQGERDPFGTRDEVMSYPLSP
ncbi:MAG: alpha/beta family hydrolase, partial [Hyphomicrobiaceae bacterium]